MPLRNIAKLKKERKKERKGGILKERRKERNKRVKKKDGNGFKLIWADQDRLRE